MERDWSIFKLLLLLLVAMSAYFSSCQQAKENDLVNNKLLSQIVSLSPQVQREIGLKTGSPQLRNLPDVFTAQGQVVVPPEGSAVVHSLVAGRIHRIFVLPGDKVKRGTPLFQLESLEITSLITACKINRNFPITRFLDRSSISGNPGPILHPVH